MKKHITKMKGILSLVVAASLLCGFCYWQGKKSVDKPVTPIENQDLTLENDGIFGFQAADFEEPILGAAKKEQLLIVEEREVAVNTTITDTGFLNLGVFNKEQALTIYGTGQYTIDLSKISKKDIQLNKETCELTVHIPHAELHDVHFDPEKTEIGDTTKGWFSFGSIKFDLEQQKQFEVTAEEKLAEKLNEKERLEEADRFAKLSAYETYLPIVKAISPAYTVVIEFQS